MKLGRRRVLEDCKAPIKFTVPQRHVEFKKGEEIRVCQPLGRRHEALVLGKGLISSKMLRGISNFVKS